MKCPTCGLENADGARECAACGQTPLAPQDSASTVDIKVSRIAIAASVCALIGAAGFMPGSIAWLDPRVLSPRSEVAVFSGFVSFVAVGCAFLLGIAGLLEIATNGGRRTGYLFAIIGTAAPFAFFTGLIFVPTFGGVKYTSYRMTCGTSLSGIGKAMLIYANDYQDNLPVAGGPGAGWTARLPSWSAQNRADAYGWSDPNAVNGRASVSASLYLLVKYCNLEPKEFVCRNDSKVREFKPGKYGVRDRQPSDLWDFGPNPPKHCSYAYNMPYGPNRLTTSVPPGLAVAADRNPWMDSPSTRAGDFSRFQPDVPPFSGTSDQAKTGNAATHYRDGQNVLFLDSHVEFVHRAYCGVDDDNIYTLWNGSDKVRGTPPKFGSQPADRLDSLLVNDPPVP